MSSTLPNQILKMFMIQGIKTTHLWALIRFTFCAHKFHEIAHNLTTNHSFHWPIKERHFLLLSSLRLFRLSFVFGSTRSVRNRPTGTETMARCRGGGVLHGSGEKNPIGPQMHKPMESVYKSMPKCRTNQVKSIKPGVFLSWIVTYKGKRLNKPRNRKKIFSPNRGRPRKPNKTDQKYHQLYNSTRLVVLLNTSH